MSAVQDIRRALEQRLNAGAYTGVTNSTDIAWENTQFDPEEKEKWLSSDLRILSIIPATADSTGTEIYRGLYDVKCFIKQNSGGTASLDLLADEVKSQFPKGLQLTENSEIINIRYSERSGFIKDNPWMFVNVQMTWYAYITP